jgi:hypothetical protein
MGENVDDDQTRAKHPELNLIKSPSSIEGKIVKNKLFVKHHK